MNKVSANGPSPEQDPLTLEDGPLNRSTRRRRAHILQVQAFLNASDEVDIDEDIEKDLLDGLEGDLDLGDEIEVDIEDDDQVSDAGPNSLGARMTEIPGDVDKDGGLEVSQIWTHQEIRGMKHHLKEYGIISFIKEYVIERKKSVAKVLCAFDVHLVEELRYKHPKTMLYLLKVVLSRELRLREKLPIYNTIADAVSLIRQAKRIIILTGAGISVSCGIPDFRSRDGLYASLKEKGEYDLDDPQQMFDIHYFKENPSVFYSFAKQIYPSNFIPSPCHRFIKLIENKNKLLRNYTQNIDTLETLAGVSRVLQCHGSFATASCIKCDLQVPGSEIEQDIQNQTVPYCQVCKKTYSKPAPPRPPKKSKKGKKKGGWDSDESDESDEEPPTPPGIMKPDITFFGEKLTGKFDRALDRDRERVDLLLVIGTSLNVSPVADVVSHLPHSVPQILINKTPVRHINPDIIMLGNADDIVRYLCAELNWDLPQPPPPSTTPVSSQSGLASRPPNLNKRPSAEVVEKQTPIRVGNSHVWLFEGAEGGKWVKQLEETLQADAEVNSGGSTANGTMNSAEREVKKARVK